MALRCPPPPRRVSEWSVQTHPAGSPFQDVVWTAQRHINPETSLERLVPLVEFLAVWRNLPNISRWGQQTIEKGYQIQFRSRPPRFMGVLSTEVAPQQVLVMEQEVKALLEKGTIEYVPHSNRETGFYSRYFIFPKKDAGLHPILDLRVLNDSFMQLKFKMLTLRQIVPQIRSEDLFVMIDLKDAYFHISILPCQRRFLRFAFGGKAYQYRVLPFCLALSPRTTTKKRPQGPVLVQPCACPLRRHIGGLLHKSRGGFAVTSTLQTGVPNTSVVPKEVVVFSSSLHPGGPQYRIRHSVKTGAKGRGMEAQVPYPRFPSALILVLHVRFHTGQALIAMVVLY